MKHLNIALISDFFLPIAGGVELHIYSLGLQLVARGHNVIVITHSHQESGRVGVRYLSGTPSSSSLQTASTSIPFLKIYHLPIPTIPPHTSHASLPNFLLSAPYLRSILLRERIHLIHGHASLSSMAHEGMFYAPFMTIQGRGRKRGIKTVFTDHSLFGFDDAVGVLTNKLLSAALRNVDGVICVSHTGRENTTLRAQLDPSIVSVIPNAVVPDEFLPDPTKVDPKHITIVVVSRLVYRKGIDLLVASTPHICELFPDVRFIVGGDGPKMVELEQMRERYLLQDRVELLGTIRSSDVPDLLNRGQIYLSTSLTEAFGISIIEAACAGLFIVSTKVGGIPEILPEDMIEFATPDADDVIRALSKAIHVLKLGKHSPEHAHQRVRGMYSWEDVAERTERVYERAMATPHKNTFERMSRLLDLGVVFGPIMCIITAVQGLFLLFLDLIQPMDEVDIVPRAFEVDKGEGRMYNG